MRDRMEPIDRKSTRLNSSHLVISYAVFCLKKKRIDGARHWPRTSDPLVGLLLRAGVPTDQLTQALSASLRTHRNTLFFFMPSPEVMKSPLFPTSSPHE